MGLSSARTSRPIFLAAILVLLAAVVVSERRPDADDQPVLRADPTRFSASGAAEAAQALLVPAEGAVVIEDHGPVEAAYRATHPARSGKLTLSVACVGDGRITLAVSTTSKGSAAPREVGRASAQCADDSVTAEVSLAGDRHSQVLIFDLVGAETATARAGFAYCVTSDTAARVGDTPEPE